MLKPAEIEKLSMMYDDKMHRLEDEIMADIIRRIKINGEITRSADWQINSLYELGLTKEEIQASIQKNLNISSEEIERLYEDIAQKAYVYDADIYKKVGAVQIPFEQNAVLQQFIEAIAAQTGTEMQNVSKSLGFAVRNADGTISFKPISKYYQDTIDNAINGISSGAFDYNTAIKKAVNEMVNSGLRSVDYASGWSNRIDVATRRAVMTGIGQITGRINEMNAESLGTDMFEVEYHLGARPSHQEWQGKVWSKEQLISVCGLGTVTGLCGANCYHTYYPFIEGVSVRTYTDEELSKLNSEENQTREYNDKKYTIYEALQRQRKLETAMRAQKQKIKLYEEGAVDEQDLEAAKAKYRATSAEYSRFSKAVGLPEQRQRVSIANRKPTPAERTSKAVVERIEKQKNEEITKKN